MANNKLLVVVKEPLGEKLSFITDDATTTAPPVTAKTIIQSGAIRKHLLNLAMKSLHHLSSLLFDISSLSVLHCSAQQPGWPISLCPLHARRRRRLVGPFHTLISLVCFSCGLFHCTDISTTPPQKYTIYRPFVVILCGQSLPGAKKALC